MLGELSMGPDKIVTEAGRRTSCTIWEVPISNFEFVHAQLSIAALPK